MKQLDILKKIAKDLKTPSHDLETVNAALKSKTSEKIKYRLAGAKMGHYGFTGLIKAITSEGVKVFDVKKVTLIPFSSIETLEKAKPREKRHIPAATAAVVKPSSEKSGSISSKVPSKSLAAKKSKIQEDDLEDEEDDDDESDFDDSFSARKSRRYSGRTPQNGSKYIPKKR